MTTPLSSDSRPVPQENQTLKRRGLFTAAWAAIVGFVIARTTQPVEAAQVSLIYENAPGGAPLNLPGATVLIINRSDFNLGAGTNVLEVQSDGTPAGLTAVFGSAANSNGVLGTTKSGIGVLGQVSSSSSSNAIAIYGLNYSTYAGPSPGAGGFAIYGLCAKGHGLVGATATAGGAAVVGATNGVAGAYAAAFYGPVIVGGDFTVVGGAKSAAVPHPDGSHRRLYCLESPESWFEDFGTGRLDCGRAEISIDRDFAMVADLSEYHVFLTEYDSDDLLHVRRRTPAGFTVEADPDIAQLKRKRVDDMTGTFSWRVVARRKDITVERLATVTIPPAPTLPPVPDEPRPAAPDGRARR
jgi:hypothetical protein